MRKTFYNPIDSGISAWTESGRYFWGWDFNYGVSGEFTMTGKREITRKEFNRMVTDWISRAVETGSFCLI